MIVTTFARLTGGSVTVRIIAPLPTYEYADDPTIFVANIFALMDSPQAILNGLYRKTDIGIAQVLKFKTAALAPLQFDNSAVKVTPSLSLIKIV